VLAGKRVGMFSYGSGNSSEFFSGVIGANATKAIAKADLDHLLASRQRIDMQEYETIMKMDPHTPPRTQAKAGAFRFTGGPQAPVLRGLKNDTWTRAAHRSSTRPWSLDQHPWTRFVSCWIAAPSS
jgi:hypothetical protein